jgi:hypothetical protein
LAHGELTGSRNGTAYPIKDDEDILRRFARLYAEAGTAVNAQVGEDLSRYEGLEEMVTEHLAAIFKSGIKGVIEQVVR